MFGELVVIDHELAAIAADQNPLTGNWPIRTFAGQPDGAWVDLGLVTAPVVVQGDGFGQRLALRGNLMVVSAPWAKGVSQFPQGSVFVFAYSQQAGWSLVSQLTIPSTHVQYFGERLGFDGVTLVVRRHKNAATAEKVVEVYAKVQNGWSHISTLSASSQNKSADYGQVISVDGDWMTVAAPGDTPPTIYIYRKNAGAWTEYQRLMVPGYLDHSFGGGRILVNDGNLKVYDLVGASWLVTGVIPHPSGSTTFFGASAVTAGDFVVASDPAAIAQSGLKGKAYVFRRVNGQWLAVQETTNGDASVPGGGAYGAAVGSDGEQLCVGAPGASSAYVHQLDADIAAEYGDACPGTGGIKPHMYATTGFNGCHALGQPISITVDKAVGGSSCVVLAGVLPSAVALQGQCSLYVNPAPVSFVLPLIGFGPGGAGITISTLVPSNINQGAIYMQAFVADAGVAQGYCATNGMHLELY